MNHSLIRHQFNEFQRANPSVYSELVELTRQAVNARKEKIGIGMLFEVLRWNRLLTTTGDAFKLNNNFRSHYARMIMQNHPEFGEIFNLRELRS